MAGRIPMQPDWTGSEEQWNENVETAFALSADILKYIQKESVDRRIPVYVAAAAINIALGRLNGRYAFRTMSYSKLWSDMMKHGKAFFKLGFDSERAHES